MPCFRWQMCSVVIILCIKEVFCLPLSQVWRKASAPEVLLPFCILGESLPFKPVPNPHVIPISELPLCISNGDKYSHCTAAPSAKKGGGLGQGNKACTAQGFDRTLLELGGKNAKSTAECGKAKQSCCCRSCRSVGYEDAPLWVSCSRRFHNVAKAKT